MSCGNPIRVLILHHSPLARVGLATTLRMHPDIEVVNTDDGLVDEPVYPPAPHPRVDVVVADYEHGVALANSTSRRPGTHLPWKVMIVASTDREWEIRSALEQGVRGYVLVGCGLEELACAVRAVHRGARHLSAAAAQRLADCLADEPLTAREQQVLRLLVEGLGNKSIARRLNIAVGTVKSHLKGVFDKLGVESRTQAVCAAERRGLLRNELPAPEGLASLPPALATQLQGLQASSKHDTEAQAAAG